jgi:hypothetical protein
MGSIEERLRTATNAGGEELWSAIRLKHPEVMSRATLNRNLTEDMALFIAKSRNANAETLGFLAADVRFQRSYKLKLAICRNPKCPQRVALGLLKYLRLFDMADMTRNQYIPVMLRQKIELAIKEKIYSMPAGIKVALSRRCCADIVLEIMQKADRRVVDECLQGPLLKEEHLYGLINRESSKPAIVQAIAEHPKWSFRYSIRYALIRNFNTPMACVDGFLCDMKTQDLQTLYDDPKLPTATKPFIFRELRRREELFGRANDETFSLPEEDTDNHDPGDESGHFDGT